MHNGFFADYKQPMRILCCWSSIVMITNKHISQIWKRIPKCTSISGHLKHVFHCVHYNHFYNPAYMLQLNIYLESSKMSKLTFPGRKQTDKQIKNPIFKRKKDIIFLMIYFEKICIMYRNKIFAQSWKHQICNLVCYFNYRFERSEWDTRQK